MTEPKDFRLDRLNRDFLSTDTVSCIRIPTVGDRLIINQSENMEKNPYPLYELSFSVSSVINDTKYELVCEDKITGEEVFRLSHHQSVLRCYNYIPVLSKTHVLKLVQPKRYANYPEETSSANQEKGCIILRGEPAIWKAKLNTSQDAIVGNKIYRHNPFVKDGYFDRECNDEDFLKYIRKYMNNSVF